MASTILHFLQNKNNFSSIKYTAKIIYILLFIFICSCVSTKRLQNSGYKDTIRQFLLAKNSSEVIFLAEKYHYILQDRGKYLQGLLFSKYRYLLRIDPSASSLTLHDNNIIEANLTLTLNTTKPPLDAARYFIAKGFKDYSGQELFIKIKFYGKRYLPNKNFRTRTFSLNRAYTLKVIDQSPDAKKRKAVLTPLTMGVDATLFLGRLIVAPICDTCDVFGKRQ